MQQAINSKRAHNQTILWLMACIQIYAVTACDLEPPLIYGDRCPLNSTDADGGIAYIRINGVNIATNTEESRRYATNIKYNICPIDAPHCKTDERGMHYCQDMFECTAPDKYRVTGYKDGNCIFDCIDGYHRIESDNSEFGFICSLMNASDCGGQDCTKLNNNNNSGWTCEHGECKAICNEGAINCGLQQCIQKGDTCSEVCESCNGTNRICTDDDGYFQCKCDIGYHEVEGQCESDTSAQCGARSMDCRDIIINSTETGCESGVCYVTECSIGFHPADDKSSCIEDTFEVCGNILMDCKDMYITEGTCIKGKCKANACATGYHVCESDDCEAPCEEDSNAHCGGHGNNCSDIDNSDEAECTNGNCAVTKCIPGYHPNDDKTACLMDTFHACGEKIINCAEEITILKTGYCQNGECKATECIPGFYLDEQEESCIPNNNDNCGRQGNKCTPDPFSTYYISSFCDQIKGICTYECDPEYSRLCFDEKVNKYSCVGKQFPNVHLKCEE